MTTEIAMPLMFAVGAYVVVGESSVAIAIGGGTAVLLQFKDQLHQMASKIGDDDFRAMTQFALISLVILPVLPNRAFGPYGVLNPYQIWWMVVLIVGLGLAGYLAYKLFGAKAGTVLAGVLGGLISSTATTVSYARRSQARPDDSHLASVVILIASAVVFLRVLVEMAVVAPGNFLRAAPPILVMLLGMVVFAVIEWITNRPDGGEMADQGNPSELRSALIFGGLYAVVLLTVAAVEEHFGTRTLYLVAVLSGLTDMDAITLSTSQMMASGRLETSVGWRVVLVASMANLLFKLAIVAILGDRRLAVRLTTFVSVAWMLGSCLLLFWPT